MQKLDQLAVNAIRILTIDAVQKAKSGHPGLAMGSAPTVYALYSKAMRHNPLNPNWADRDRFVLSAGHASMMLYSTLHLLGYGTTIEDLKNFRQWGSKTPGHPESGHTVGVEATGGPLGMGVATAVGMAMAEKHLAAKFNRDGFNVVDHYTYCLAGDGCMMEGIASEASSMAATMGLDKLILFYDSNAITIEGSTDLAFHENVGKRYEAYGWHVQEIADGNDMDAILQAIEAAKATKGKPSLIIITTQIAYGSPLAGMAKAHGEPLGDDNIKATRANLNWPCDEAFELPKELKDNMAGVVKGLAKQEAAWNELFIDYRAQHPSLAEEWDAYMRGEVSASLFEDKALWDFSGKMATRVSSEEVLKRLSKAIPNLFGGSADLAPSNKSYIKGRGDFSAQTPEGANVHFGVREFAMAAACNGIALHGGLIPYCATFFVFSDYLKNALRMNALTEQRVIYILTHDSIGVGEDGPTHQPIEQLAAIRAMPNALMFRPADSKETVAAYLAALCHEGPTAIALTRQNLPLYDESGPKALRGGYIISDSENAEPDVILIASGSEVELAINAQEELITKDIDARVVSMPCMELFDMQDDSYIESVLPSSVRARVAIEAGSSFGWHKYVGLDGDVLAIDHFGASAPADILFEKFGFTVERVVEKVLSLLV